MSQKNPRKRIRPRPVPTAPEPMFEASPAVVFDDEPVPYDELGHLAIGLAAGGLAVVTVLVVLILIAAN